MPNPIDRLTTKVKDKIARRNYERDSKYIIGDLGPIGSAFRDHLGIYDHDHDQDENDTSTVSSFSTTATVDNNPGAGCTVDKYFYQPVGRRIEKIVFQIAMPYLSPGRILQYIEENKFKGHLSFDDMAVSFARHHELDPVLLTGLNTLVHQTQSSSVIRSSAALSALIRLCPIDVHIEDFYKRTHNRMRNTNLAALAVNNGGRENKCYLFLETLSWARPSLWDFNPEYNLRIYSPSLWKGSLLKLIQSWRTNDDDAFAIISEACLQFARLVEILISVRKAEPIALHYFFTLFIIQFIPFICHKSTCCKCEQRTQQLYYMLLSTFLRWLDSALYTFFSYRLYDIKLIAPMELEKGLEIFGLLLQYHYSNPVFTTILPETSRYLRTHEAFDIKLLPRNVHHSGSHRIIIGNVIRGSMARNQRLLKSIDELEREMRDTMSIPTVKGKFRVQRMPNFKYTLSQARRAQVFNSDTNEEFLDARRGGGYAWREYKRRCRMRHEWGIYFRSNLDWDWDTESCLKCLFELSHEPVSSATSIATVNLDPGEADTWNISTEATLPQKMKVAYKSATGETKYKTFFPSSDDVASSGELTQDDEEQEEVSFILPEPCCGGDDEAEEGPGVVAHENNDAAAATETDVELGVTDTRFCSDDSDNGEHTEEISKNLKAMHERQVDQISICSLD